MKKFAYIEDYLEVINGDRNPETGKIYDLFSSTPPIINLARYDVQIINSMSEATQSGKPLTDRQAELSVKIILKYRKQLEKQGIDISPVETPNFKLGIRQIDRRRLLYVENNKIVLQFPYDTTLINDIRDLAKLSQGAWSFDNDKRAWCLAITEANVIAANGFAKNNQFELDKNFIDYVSEVESCEQTPYEIKLIKTNSGLEITNAAKSLVEAVNNYCGFDSSNIDLLIDNAPIYGYAVDEEIKQQMASTYSPRICNLMTAQESKFKPDADHTVYEDVIEYAKIVGRYPIYVYEPDMSDRLYKNFVERYFDPNDVHQVRELKPDATTTHKKVIYFNKYTAQWNQPITLLISGQGMMHGGEKTLLLQQAKKVVYFATEVYNTKNLKKTINAS